MFQTTNQKHITYHNILNNLKLMRFSSLLSGTQAAALFVDGLGFFRRHVVGAVLLALLPSIGLKPKGTQKVNLGKLKWKLMGIPQNQ